MQAQSNYPHVRSCLPHIIQLVVLVTECHQLRTVFLKLKYLKHLFNLVVTQFLDFKVADQQHIPSTNMTTPPIQVIIPFKDQVSANEVKKRLTAQKSRPPFGPCTSAESSTKTLKFAKSSQPLLTKNV